MLDNAYVLAYTHCMTTISATKARADLYDLIEDVSKKRKRIGITNKGETKAILISARELESLEETLDILSSNPNIVRELEQIEEDYKRGNVYDWEDVKKELQEKRKRRGRLSTNV